MDTNGYKLIAIDIDGTLLNSSLEITPEVKEALRRAKAAGLRIVLATGRPIDGMDDYLRELDFYHPGEYAITSNGSLLTEPATGREIVRHAISKEDFQRIHTLATKLDVGYVIETDHCYYTTHTHLPVEVAYLSYINKLPLVIIDPEDLPDDVRYIKGMISDALDRMEDLPSQLPEEVRSTFATMMSSATILEVLNPKATKAQTLSKLLDKLEIQPEEVLALGDNQNDMDMLALAGTGVAMGNARPEVKEIADYITKTNDENGVAVAINKFIFNE